jgi:hypothetical protein
MTSPNNEMVSYFSQLVNAQPGVYNYINEDNSKQDLFLSRKSKYTFRLMDVENTEFPK